MTGRAIKERGNTSSQTSIPLVEPEPFSGRAGDQTQYDSPFYLLVVAFRFGAGTEAGQNQVLEWTDPNPVDVRVRALLAIRTRCCALCVLWPCALWHICAVAHVCCVICAVVYVPWPGVLLVCCDV